MDEKQSIFICEDDKDILELLTYVLSEYKLVTQSHIHDDIVEVVKGIRPNLILMDYLIPDIGGVQAVLQLKSDPETMKIPVLMFSASSMIEQHSKESKADGYIEKPFKLDDLRKSIKDLLNRKPGN